MMACKQEDWITHVHSKWMEEREQEEGKHKLQFLSGPKVQAWGKKKKKEPEQQIDWDFSFSLGC